MITAIDLAKYLIKVETRPDFWEYITNLKLQKILYYIQWYHIAIFWESIFSEEIVALQYWPVIKEVYEEYKRFWSNGIDELYNDFDASWLWLHEDQIGLISSVWSEYWQFSAWKLVDLTHDDWPRKLITNDWRNIWRDVIITKEMMGSFFKTQIE